MFILSFTLYSSKIDPWWIRDVLIRADIKIFYVYIIIWIYMGYTHMTLTHYVGRVAAKSPTLDKPVMLIR